MGAFIKKLSRPFSILCWIPPETDLETEFKHTLFIWEGILGNTVREKEDRQHSTDYPADCHYGQVIMRSGFTRKFWDTVEHVSVIALKGPGCWCITIQLSSVIGLGPLLRHLALLPCQAGRESPRVANIRHLQKNSADMYRSSEHLGTRIQN